MEKKPKLHWIQIVAIAFIALFCVAVAIFGYHIEECKKNNAAKLSSVSHYSTYVVADQTMSNIA